MDVLHGVKVADPYRWLEDGAAKEVAEWTRAQNAYTEKVLGTVPGREALAARLESLLRIGWVGSPTVTAAKTKNKRYFFRKQGPTEDQPVLFVRDGKGERVLLDPNTLAKDGTVSLDYWYPSPDGKLLAYGVSSGGDEESTLKVLDVDTGKHLPETEVITRARYASVAWLPDRSGFYYTRYPAKGSVPAGEERYHSRVFEHRMGRKADEDPVVFGEGRKMTDMPIIDISPNGRWLVASVHMGWSRREVYLADRQHPATKAGKPVWTPLAVPKEDAVFDVSAFDDHLLVRTNDRAPTYRLYRVDPKKPAQAAWKEIVPAGKHVLEAATAIGGDVFGVYIEDAKSVVKRFSKEGKELATIALPTIGRVGGVSGAHDGDEAFLSFSSFTVPVQVLRLELAAPIDAKPGVWAEVKAPVDASEFSVEQLRAKSKDGTSVPMFVVRKKGLPKDGSTPTILYGYGGFNISLFPEWAGARFAFLERGGAYVIANLRGGGEYGEDWHRAGMLESKQKVFDDFVAVAQHLVAEKITSPEKLGIVGGSNGGLLVGAAVTQRPDLFRAAVSLVPLHDMVRYHRFLLAKLWVPEYGSADDPEQFKWLFAYSPYHHVVPGTRYPAVLLATAEGDSRVDPLHARKMAAMLQHAGESAPGGGRPVLLRIEEKAGHGAGKPISKRIRESTDLYTFLFNELGLPITAGAAPGPTEPDGAKKKREAPGAKL